MNNKKIVLAVFALVVSVQLYVPAKMIWNKEDVLETGAEFKFKTAPIDPSDPFRGKYITLGYEQTTFEVSNEEEWVAGESIFVSLTTDDEGFAKVKSISKSKPGDTREFIKANVGFVTGDGSNKLSIEYPFDRYYIEESKAYDAELIHQRFQQDTSKITYALVSIKNGDAVLKDVMIDGTSIREIILSNRKEFTE